MSYQASLLNSLPDDKISDLSKFKLTAVADDNLIMAQSVKFVSRMLENVGKEENAAYEHSFSFPKCFPNLSFSGALNS